MPYESSLFSFSMSRSPFLLLTGFNLVCSAWGSTMFGEGNANTGSATLTLEFPPAEPLDFFVCVGSFFKRALKGKIMFNVTEKSLNYNFSGLTIGFLCTIGNKVTFKLGVGWRRHFARIFYNDAKKNQSLFQINPFLPDYIFLLFMFVFFADEFEYSVFPIRIVFEFMSIYFK